MRNCAAYSSLSMLALCATMAGCHGINQVREEGAPVTREGSTPAKTLSKESMAIIKNIPRTAHPRNKEVFIQSVDGRKSGAYVAAVEMHPGRHELEIYCMSRDGTSSEVGGDRHLAAIQVVVKAGQEYKLDAQIDNVGCVPELKEIR